MTASAPKLCAYCGLPKKEVQKVGDVCAPCEDAATEDPDFFEEGDDDVYPFNAGLPTDELW